MYNHFVPLALSKFGISVKIFDLSFQFPAKRGLADKVRYLFYAGQKNIYKIKQKMWGMKLFYYTLIVD
jgi:hypothetical protein